VVGDVLVDSETPVVTSSILKFAGPTQFFGGAHRGRKKIELRHVRSTIILE
jgi:hypothetical protein